MSKTVFVVNEEKRTLTRTGGEPVFVEGDKFVDSVDILFPDYFEDMDLNTSLVRIMYKTSGASEVRRVALTTFQTDDRQEHATQDECRSDQQADSAARYG